MILIGYHCSVFLGFTDNINMYIYTQYIFTCILYIYLCTCNFIQDGWGKNKKGNPVEISLSILLRGSKITTCVLSDYCNRLWEKREKKKSISLGKGEAEIWGRKMGYLKSSEKKDKDKPGR